MRVAIAGGGTGGHLFPALAVAEVLRERKHEAVVFISEKEIDALATQNRDEFKFEKIPGMGMPSVFSPAMFTFLRTFLESLSTCKAVYKRFKPDAVLGMGGFTSTGPILAARRRKIPSFLHESNAIPGKANRLNARLADRVFVGFEECSEHFPGKHCEVTGTPIRRSLGQKVDKEAALAKFGFTPERRTLLVMGGSQGARGINDSILNALPDLKELPLQIIHLTGSNQEQVMQANYRREGLPAHVAAFCHEMENAYSAADLAISRSGAASMNELAHFGLPSILIPYPHAAENHQALNAEIFERSGAAKVMEQESVTGATLTAALRDLLLNPACLQRMAQNVQRLAPTDAAERVVDAIEEVVNANRRA